MLLQRRNDIQLLYNNVMRHLLPIGKIILMFKVMGFVSGKSLGSRAGKYLADLKVVSLAPLYFRILRFELTNSESLHTKSTCAR